MISCNSSWKNTALEHYFSNFSMYTNYSKFSLKCRLCFNKMPQTIIYSTIINIIINTALCRQKLKDTSMDKWRCLKPSFHSPFAYTFSSPHSSLVWHSHSLFFLDMPRSPGTSQPPLEFILLARQETKSRKMSFILWCPKAAFLQL